MRISQARYSGANSYIPGNAWFICDRCGQRHRRSAMFTEWDGLKVDRKCLDPRPPQMEPPNIYPEGIPFPDARPPQDNPDRLQDDTALQSITGGMAIQPGVLHPDGQDQLPGSLSPLQLVENPTPQGPNVLADDVTFITGPVFPPDNTTPPTPPVTGVFVLGESILGGPDILGG